MEKINFENNVTKANADTFNTLQDNIETAINGIIESGSNSNGNWIKFQDGTLIQTMYIELPAGSGIATSDYGSLYLGSYTWTFPIEFNTSEVPKVNCGLFKWGTGASFGTTREPTYSAVTLRGLDTVARTTATSVSISAIAIGRWK